MRRQYPTLEARRSARSAIVLSARSVVALVFFNVSGGPFGSEGLVSAAGPALALLGLLVFPLIWSAPEVRYRPRGGRSGRPYDFVETR